MPFSRFRGSRAEPIRVFPRLARCTCFPTLSIWLMFSRAWLLVHVFPRLAAGSCFPPLGSWFMFFCALQTNACFPNSHTAYKGYLAARATYNSPQTLSWYKSFFPGLRFWLFTAAMKSKWFGYGEKMKRPLFSVLFFFFV